MNTFKILILFFIFQIKLVSKEFEITPLNINFKGVVCNDSNVISYGDYGSILLSTNNGNTWKQIRVFENGSIINCIYEKDRIVTFSSNGEISISKNNGFNWELISKINDNIVGVIIHPKGYAIRSENKLRILNPNFSVYSSKAISSIRGFYKNYIWQLYQDTIDFNQTMTIHKNDLVISIDYPVKYVKYNENLTPIDTLNVDKVNNCTDCLRNYYIYSDSNYIYFTNLDSIFKCSDFINFDSFLKLNNGFLRLQSKSNNINILEGRIWGADNQFINFSKIVNDNYKYVIGNVDFIINSLVFDSRILKGFDFNEKYLFLVKDNKVIIKINFISSQVEIISEFSQSSKLINPDFLKDNNSIYYTADNENGKIFLGAFNYNIIYKTHDEGITFHRVWGNHDYTKSGFTYFKNFNNKLNLLTLYQFNSSFPLIQPEISGLYISNDNAESFKYNRTEAYTFPILLNNRANCYKNELGYVIPYNFNSFNSKTLNFTRTSDNNFKPISLFQDSNYTIFYTNSKDTNTFLFQTYDDIDSTIIIKYTKNKGRNWETIKEFPFKYDLFYNIEIELNDTNYLASAYISETEKKLEFGILNLESRRYQYLYTYNYLDTNLRHYTAITSDSNKIYLAVKDTIFEIFDYLNPNTWKQFILPNNGRIRKTFRKNNDKFLARYSDLNNEDNLYWIKITNKPKLIPEILAVDNDFGNVDIKDKISKTQVLNIGNTSKNADLIITGYSKLNQSVFLTDLPKVDLQNPIIIQPNTYYHFQVQFKPSAVKKYIDSIVFYSNAVISDSVTFLKGEGIDTIKSSVIEDQTYFYSYPPFPTPSMYELKSLIYWDMSYNIDDSDIDVYDIYGNKVADKDKISINKLNTYSGYLSWDCSGASTGVYMIQIKHGTNTHNIRAVVVR
ncbi:MAG: hypothetical protein NTW25_07570 [Candidatus Kapabacteria bacterium]|nr:hypothetical protein [Candidatus Kapabacteria bacterium]